MPSIFVLLVAVLLLSACAQSAHQTGLARYDTVVPEGLREQVDRSVSFPELKAAPDKYEGRVLLVGGVVLNARRAKDQTEIEVLELPLTAELVPVYDRARSEGRFLAVREEFLDPATLPAGTPITVIGEVKGTATRPLDDAPYSYPVLEIKQLTNWKRTSLPNSYRGVAPYQYSYPYGAYDYYNPYWGPYGYPSYWYGIPVVPSAPPNPPPSESIPPQFKK